MTVIAYRDGVMAADRQTVHGSTKTAQVRKIWRREADGALIGAAGCGTLAAEFCRWFVAGEDPATRPVLRAVDGNDAGAIIVRPDGSIEEHDHCGWRVLESAFVAMGSGADFALVAMEFGADPRKAIEVACRYDVHCGGDIDVLQLGDVSVAPVRTIGLVRKE